jgi:hypothetical protein
MGESWMIGRRAMLGIALALLVAPARAAQPTRYSDREVRGVVKRLDDRAGDFRRHLDPALDRSPLDGSRREDNINGFARDFHAAVRRLSSSLGDRQRSSTAVEEVLWRASAIERFMERQRLDEAAERDWALLRADLSELARMHGVRWGRDRWAGHPADRNVAALLARIAERTAEFQGRLSGELERGRLANSRQEETVARDVQRFQAATDRMRQQFEARRADRDDVRQVIRRAQPIDRFVRRWQVAGRAERTWNGIRGDLEQLGAVYGVTFRWEVAKG